MSVSDLAKGFTDLLKQNDHEGAAEKYNADNVVSYEAPGGPMAVCNGKEAVKQKSEWWRANHEVHGGSVEGPFVNGDQFAVRFKMDVTPKGGVSPQRQMERAELRERLDAAIARLTPEHRAVILLKEVEGMQYHEIADVVGCSIGTVMSRLFYARKKLQTLLKDLHENI